MLALDVRKLQREGMLENNVRSVQSWSKDGELFSQASMEADSESVTIAYKLTEYTGQTHDIKQHVWLTTTPCNYGRERVWFECPRCAGRVAFVYLSMTVACRKCHNLNYRCQRETDSDRGLRRLHRIQGKLKAGSYSSFEQAPERPRYMKQSKYQRLRFEHLRAQREAMAGLCAVVDRL